jgi:diaminohydroxyphosphoribosylaminopyrimidine deaminase/5-amino-6-(5-phosphoribosylamino)uracil reductase
MTNAPWVSPRDNPTTPHDRGEDNADTWGAVPRMLRESENLLPPPWQDIFGPLRHGRVDDLVVVGQCGQSIDARIATASGHSHYINGPDGLAHLHRLRAVVDAAVVGIGTVQADDPQLTVRRVAGPHPARVVIDPRGRLPPTAKLLADDGTRRLVLTCGDTQIALPAGVEVVRLAASNGHIAPAAILTALAGCGFRRILIEGGANTLSRFIAAGCLDRLHVMIAPIILGSGAASVSLPEVARVDQALQAPMRPHVLGREVLLDCDLSAQRIGIGKANRST